MLYFLSLLLPIIVIGTIFYSNFIRPTRGMPLQAVFYNQFAPTIDLTPNDEYVVENGLDQVALKQLLSGTLDTNSALRAAEEKANQAIDLQK